CRPLFPYTTLFRSWHPYHHIRVLSPAVMYLGEIVYNLVEPHRHEVCELHFHHALEPFETQSKCRANYRALAKRSVSHPSLAEILHESFGDLECATIFSNVLSH